MKRDDVVGRAVAYFLGKWGKKLIEQHSIPAILIGEGVDDREGEYVLLCPNGQNVESVADLLRQVLAELESGKAQVGQK